jgi:hypothetical protein
MIKIAIFRNLMAKASYFRPRRPIGATNLGAGGVSKKKRPQIFERGSIFASVNLILSAHPKPRHFANPTFGTPQREPCCLFRNDRRGRPTYVLGASDEQT